MRWLEAVVAGEEKPVAVEGTAKVALVMHGPAGLWWKIEDEAQARLAALVVRHLGEAC